jgi:pimeloyl-ACP methyl ester carboxylesterase
MITDRLPDLPCRVGDELLKLAIYRQPAAGDCVLYVHGATFPSALSVAWRMNGESWLDHLQSAGFDAWAFDFAGYGASQRPRVFAAPADAHLAFGRSTVAAAQIEAVLLHIRRQRPDTPIHLLAHSWGTLPAQQVAIARPDLVARLVLFGPVVPRQGTALRDSAPAWRLITAADQRPRHRNGLPEDAATPVDDAEIERWCTAYLRTDAQSGCRVPASVQIPSGPMHDVAEMFAGAALVDSAAITQPTLIIRGEWDDIAQDADARRLFDALVSARDKRDVKIARGNHWMHLQPSRHALWAETRSFLSEAPDWQ